VNLEQAALGIAVPVQGRVMHNTQGGSTFQPYGVSANEVNYSISRTKLNALLIDAAEKNGVEFIFEHEVVQMDFSTMKGVYRSFTDRTKERTINAALFVGTDGVGSMTRQLMHKEIARIEGVVPIDDMERLGVSYKELTFPALADGSYSMRSSGLHIWPRGPAFLMALADKGKHLHRHVVPP